MISVINLMTDFIFYSFNYKNYVSILLFKGFQAVDSRLVFKPWILKLLKIRTLSIYSIPLFKSFQAMNFKVAKNQDIIYLVLNFNFSKRKLSASSLNHKETCNPTKSAIFFFTRLNPFFFSKNKNHSRLKFPKKNKTKGLKLNHYITYKTEPLSY